MRLLDVLKDRLVQPRRIRRRPISFCGDVDSLESRLLLTAPTMTDSEQYMLELINRARANPAAEAARYGIGLNDGVAPEDTISTAPKQPLAPQQQLVTAAVLHSQDMLDRDYFSHTTQGAGTTFDQRVTNQGYVWSLVAENIGYAAKTVSVSQTAFIEEVHEGLIRSAGHRESIMLPELEEVGIGARIGAFKPANDPTTYQFTEMVTEDFGSRNLNPYITGVVYTDANSNNFYTIGESIRSGTVTAVDVASGAVYSDTIGNSGAYGFIVPAGTYIVTATITLSGTPRTYQKSGNVVVATDNVKIDFETNTGTLATSTLTLESAANTLYEIGVTTTTLFTVARNGSTASSLTVNLVSSDTSEVTVPVTVVIPAGQSSATFTASAVDDGVIDGNQSATITASASGLPSAVRTLTVLDRTYPSLPGSTQTVATSRPTFTWTSVSNAATYEIWVNNTTTGESRVVNTAGIAANTYTTVVDLPIGTYSIWVRGFTSAGLAGFWSPMAVWQLRPPTTVLGAGRTEANRNFTVTWTPVSGAASYDIWIDRLTSSTIQYLRNSSVTGNSLAVSNFEIGSYKIWVRARNAAGDYTGWSSATVYVNYAPATVSVNAAGLSATPTLTWSMVVGAVQYDVWINNLTTGTSAAIRDTEVPGSSLALNTATAASYRVWVRARDLNGNSYAWSSSFDFEVGRASRITAPTGNGQPARPIFAWTPVAGATRYEIWLSNVSTGLREISETNLTTTSYTPPTDLASANTYRVWIRAFDSSGAASAWSLSLTFTIASDLSTWPNLRQLPPTGDEPVLDRVFASAETWLPDPVRDARAMTIENSEVEGETSMTLQENATSAPATRGL